MKLEEDKVVFEDHEVWNLVDTFSKIIVQGLQQLLALDGTSVPGVIVEELYGPDAYMKELDDDYHNYAFKVWRERIEFIIKYLDEGGEPEYEGGFVEGPQHLEEELEGLKRWDYRPDDPEAWDKYKEELDKYYYNRKIALMYLGKYFDSFWD